MLILFRGVPCPPLYVRGDRVTCKVLTQYSWSPTTIQSGSFLCTAVSSTPIWIVTRKVKYIHELSLTLEHSMPISSPAAPGLTGPRALRSRVLQASSTWLGVFEYIKLSDHPSGCFWAFIQVRRVVLQVLPVASMLWGAQAPKFYHIWCVKYSRSIWSSPRALGWIAESGWGSVQSFSFIIFQKFEK